MRSTQRQFPLSWPPTRALPPTPAHVSFDRRRNGRGNVCTISAEFAAAISGHRRWPLPSPVIDRRHACGLTGGERHTTEHVWALITVSTGFTLRTAINVSQHVTPETCGGRRRWHVDALPKAG